MVNQKTALSKVDSFKSLINTQSMVKRMTTALGSKDKAGQFMASMLDLYESDKLLQNCDAEKVVMECLKAASLNLPLVKSIGMAYVVPYGSTPTFIVGYKGLIQLALRSGQYKALNADCIYEGEEITSNRMT
ncbi:MAG: recombinase RecT, partial [Clostridiales bacterium]|nr:recombinase RecT [Clostridiales bacterium]